MRVEARKSISEEELETVHGWLAQSYWAAGRSLEMQRVACANSINFLVKFENKTVGFARVVTDQSTFAWICDVIVEESYRGRGIGKLLMSEIDAHPDLKNLRRSVLATRDAHGLYEQFGFSPLPHPDRWMMRVVEQSTILN